MNMDEKKQNGKGDNQQNLAVLQVNGLRYTMPQNLSTTLVRTHKICYADRGIYLPGETVSFTFNVSGFIDPDKSYLRFDVSTRSQAGNHTSGFGTFGSGMNFFRDMRLQSKN